MLYIYYMLIEDSVASNAEGQTFQLLSISERAKLVDNSDQKLMYELVKNKICDTIIDFLSCRGICGNRHACNSVYDLFVHHVLQTIWNAGTDTSDIGHIAMHVAEGRPLYVSMDDKVQYSDHVARGNVVQFTETPITLTYPSGNKHTNYEIMGIVTISMDSTEIKY